jgi:hypothetical protein
MLNRLGQNLVGGVSGNRSEILNILAMVDCALLASMSPVQIYLCNQTVCTGYCSLGKC